MGFLFFILATATVLLSAYVVASRFRCQSTTEFVLIIFLFSYSQIILTSLFAGVILHKLTANCLFLINILVLFATCFILQHDSLKKQFNLLKTGYTTLLTAVSQNRFLWFFIGLAIMVSIYILYFGYLFPPYSWDSLTYHLPPVASWIQNHKIGIFDGIDIFGYTYPKNGEMLFLWYLIFTKNDLFLNLTQMVLLIIGCIVIYGIAKQILKLPVEYCLLSAILYFLVPINVMQADTCYVDLIFMTMFLMSLYFILLLIIHKQVNLLWIIGMSLGIFFGIKPNSIGYSAILLLVLLLILLWIFRYNFLKTIGYFSVVFLIIILLGGYWYYTTWRHYGNPLYPISFKIGSFYTFPGYRDMTDFRNRELAIQNYMSVPRIFLNNWFEWNAKYVFDCSKGGFGIVWIAWMLPSILWYLWDSIRKRQYLVILFTSVLLLCFIIQPVNYSSRYTIYLTALGSISLSWVLNQIKFRKIAFLLLFVSLLFQIFMISDQEYFTVDKQNEFRYLESKYKTSGFVLDTPHDAFEFIDCISEKDDVIYFNDIYFDFIYPLWGNRLQRKVYYLKNNELNSIASNKEAHSLIVVGESSSLLPTLLKDTSYSLLFNDKNYVFSENQEKVIQYFENNLKKAHF